MCPLFYFLLRILFKYSDRVVEGASHPSLKGGMSISMMVDSSHRIAMKKMIL